MARKKRRANDNVKISKLLYVAKKMPPLYHKLPGKEYDVKKSEMVKWLIQQPEILEYISDRIRGNYQFVTYDKETGKWQGVDYNGD